MQDIEAFHWLSQLLKHMTPDLSEKKKRSVTAATVGCTVLANETSLIADSLIHCLGVCVGDKAAPVPSQSLF